MTITPTTTYLLVRLHHLKPKSLLMTPDDSSMDLTYGEVISAGPDCKHFEPKELILFHPSNMVAGFDRGGDEKYIVPSASVFGRVTLDEEDKVEPVNILMLNSKN